MVKTVGKDRSWGLVVALAGVVLLQPVACTTPEGVDTDSPPETDEVTQLLRDAGGRVVLPALSAFREAASEMSADIAAWAEAPSDASAREAAQASFKNATLAWQHVELMQIGPLASSLTAVAGGDLRDEIYSWPANNRCRVEQELIAEEFVDDGFFEAKTVNSYGIDALEVLLFLGDAENACPPQVNINREGSWDALSLDELDAKRADYSVVLSEQVVVLADQAIQAWSEDGDNFSGNLSLDNDSSDYGNSNEALNAVYDAMFYLEKITKDAKLGMPLGLVDCPTSDCTGNLESIYAGDSTEFIKANLEGFREVFTGGDGYGYDDLLVDRGHGDLSDEILANLDAADSAVADMGTSIQDALAEDDVDDAIAAYDAIRAVAVLVKRDLATVLELQVPQEGAGDND